MARTTLSGAASDLFALLADTDGNPVTTLASAGVVKCYPAEPGATGVAKPLAVTVQFSGWDPTDWRFNVRIYGPDQISALAQDAIISAQVAVDSVLKASGWVGPSQGEVEWFGEGVDRWIASGVVMVGREDGF